jgi:hypothetical protein
MPRGFSYRALTLSLTLGFVMPVVAWTYNVGLSADATTWRSTRAGDADPNEALNEPDRFNWELFARINQIAPQQSQIGPAQATTNNAIWETWADDEITFPAHPDPKSPPAWPAPGAAPAKQLAVSTQQLFAARLRSQASANVPEQFRPQPVPLPRIPTEGGSEEVRRNKDSFDFIVSEKLWYVQGLQAAFREDTPITFPIGAIEIKARWKPISAAEQSQYHWNYDSHGKLFGLIALHIMSKAIPNWTWATWEWVGNPGRCDYIGCRDYYGAIPGVVPPNAKVGGQYPGGQLSPALLALFRQSGLSPEWQNYRLKGSQTDFVDVTGKHSLLGNSVTEAGFVPSSSCMTCHAQASADAQGQFPPSVGFTPDGQSTNGAPDPTWFYNEATNPWTPKYLPIDFVWGILSAKPTI